LNRKLFRVRKEKSKKYGKQEGNQKTYKQDAKCKILRVKNMRLKIMKERNFLKFQKHFSGGVGALNDKTGRDHC